MYLNYIVFINLFLWTGLTLPAQQLVHLGNATGPLSNFNPAVGNTWNYLEATANYRQQWMGFENAPTTILAEVTVPFNSLNMGLGLNIIEDEVGPFSQRKLGLNYNYGFELGLVRNDRLSLGVQVAFWQYRLDINKFQPNDPTEGYSIQQTNFGAGLFYTTTSEDDFNEESFFFLGLAANQIQPLDLEYEGLGNLARSLHANLITGIRLVGDWSFIEPSIRVHYASEDQLYIALRLHYELLETFWMGLAYANDHTISVFGGFILSPYRSDGQIRLGVEGNYNIGLYGPTRGLGFEFVGGYRYFF